jgi:hypothetical protein
MVSIVSIGHRSCSHSPGGLPDGHVSLLGLPRPLILARIGADFGALGAATWPFCWLWWPRWGLCAACVRSFVCSEATAHGRGHVQGQLARTMATDRSGSSYPGQGCDPWSWSLLVSPRGVDRTEGTRLKGPNDLGPECEAAEAGLARTKAADEGGHQERAGVAAS